MSQFHPVHHRLVFFFKQKTAYEMRISDWSSDVCSNQLSRKLRADLVNRSSTSRLALSPSRDRPQPCEAPAMSVRSPSPTLGGDLSARLRSTSATPYSASAYWGSMAASCADNLRNSSCPRWSPKHGGAPCRE